MQTYIGTKIIKARPMTREEYKTYFGNDNDIQDIRFGESETMADGDEEGYVVIYPDGYRSWSPTAVFEATHRLISDKEKELID